MQNCLCLLTRFSYRSIGDSRREVALGEEAANRCFVLIHSPVVSDRVLFQKNHVHNANLDVFWIRFYMQEFM